MNKIYLKIIFGILLGACTNSLPTYKAFEYQSPILLEGVLLNNTFIFSDPAEIVFVDSLLIVHDSQKQDYCFHIFDSRNGNFIKSFGSKGRGPGEIIFPESMNYSSNRQALTTYDPNLKKIVLYHIEQILNNEEPYYSEIKTLESPGLIYQALPYKNNFILRGCDSKMRFGVLDSLNKVIPLYTDFPKIVPSEEENWAIANYVPQCAISPNGTKMVSATYIGGIFEIFNIKQNQISADTIQFYYQPIYKIVQGFKPKWIGTTPETIIGCHNICVSNNLIYSIYEGESAKKDHIHKKLILFNWKGEIFKQYCFKEGDPISICVDETNKDFYCIILNEKYEYQIYRYHYNDANYSFAML